MKILIIGGTKFLGRAMVESALASGHEVTLFNRGKTNADLFPEVEKLIGDRRSDLSALAGRSWDAVIDTSGYIPREINLLGEALRGNIGHYTFISSISVYEESNFTQSNTPESGSLQVLSDPTVETIIGETYGGLKVLCEQAAEQQFADQTLIIRPGFIVGPHDPTFRLNYWLSRAAKGGEMLAPGAPDHPLQIIDVRDLADWTIRLVEGGQTGIYNATGPQVPLPWGEVLQMACQLANPDTQLIWVEEAFLLTHEITPFAHLPLWVPRQMAGVHQVSIQKALADGLTFRSLEDTIQITLPFAIEMAQSLPESDASLRLEQEQATLQQWHQHFTTTLS